MVLHGYADALRLCFYARKSKRDGERSERRRIKLHSEYSYGGADDHHAAGEPDRHRGQTASFSVAATGTAPLSYQWQKNGANIAGATSAGYTTPASRRCSVVLRAPRRMSTHPHRVLASCTLLKLLRDVGPVFLPLIAERGGACGGYAEGGVWPAWTVWLAGCVVIVAPPSCIRCEV